MDYASTKSVEIEWYPTCLLMCDIVAEPSTIRVLMRIRSFTTIINMKNPSEEVVYLSNPLRGETHAGTG